MVFRAGLVETVAMGLSAYFVFNMSTMAIVRESDGKVLTFVRADQPSGWNPPEGTRAIPETELPLGWEKVEEEFDSPSLTAEAWLEAQGYGGSRPTLLLYRKMQLDALGLQSLKLAAAQFWMDNLLAAVSLNPDEQRTDWQPAPYPFAEVTAECQQLLAPPTEPPAA